ncbi:MAG: transcription antitermination factor NusB [Bdellovibrionota bacterium]
MGVRRQAREAALQALFMCDFISDWSIQAADFCLEHFSIPKSVRPYAAQLCAGVIQNLAKIDSSLTCASEHWSLNRMGRVDRSILRLATFELVFLDEIPVNVAINEAIEIAKRFGAEESPHFVNGVLDRVASLNKPKIEVEKVPPRAAEGRDAELPAAAIVADDLEEEVA